MFAFGELPENSLEKIQIKHIQFKIINILSYKPTFEFYFFACHNILDLSHEKIFQSIIHSTHLKSI